VNNNRQGTSLLDRTKDRYTSISFHPLDYTVIIYLLFLGFLIIPFHNEVSHWGLYPIVHLVCVILILEFLRYFSQKPSKTLHFFRTFYPALLLAFGWTELNSLITMIFPYWANDFVVNIDTALFGVYPTVWVESIFSPLLTEVM